MKAYLKITHFKVPLYGGNLVIILTNSTKKIKKYIPNFEDNDIYAHSYYHTFKNKQGFFVILNFNNKYRKMDHGTITHEAIHNSHFILQCIGGKSDFNDDEPEAYLAEWITDKVYKYIKKNKLVVR